MPATSMTEKNARSRSGFRCASAHIQPSTAPRSGKANHGQGGNPVNKTSEMTGCGANQPGRCPYARWKVVYHPMASATRSTRTDCHASSGRIGSSPTSDSPMVCRTSPPNSGSSGNTSSVKSQPARTSPAPRRTDLQASRP